jgi:hypothetical protein
MRYYFHVLGVGRTYKDDEGMSFRNAEHAKGHAQFMAYELFRLLGEEFHSDQRVTAISVLVTDEMGKEITRAPLRLGVYLASLIPMRRNSPAEVGTRVLS